MLSSTQENPQDSSSHYAKNLIIPEAGKGKQTLSHILGISLAVGGNEITVLRENKPTVSFKKRMHATRFDTVKIEKSMQKARKQLSLIEEFRISKGLPSKVTIKKVPSICLIYGFLNKEHRDNDEDLKEGESYEFRGFTFQETLNVNLTKGIAFLLPTTAEKPYPYHSLMNVEKKYAIISIDPETNKKIFSEKKKIIGFIIPD